MVQELGVWHLSTITASDLGPSDAKSDDPQPDGIEVLYHFWLGRGLTVRCTLPYENPRLASVSDLIPGAAKVRTTSRSASSTDSMDTFGSIVSLCGQSRTALAVTTNGRSLETL